MQSIPHFHDGYVTGIRLRDQAATVYIRQVDGADFELALEGLEVLQMEDFRQGNIISMVEVVAGRTSSVTSCLDRLFVAPHPSAAAKYHEAHACVLKRQVARIEQGETCLVAMVPSYGADLLAICREVICRPL